MTSDDLTTQLADVFRAAIQANLDVGFTKEQLTSGFEKALGEAQAPAASGSGTGTPAEPASEGEGSSSTEGAPHKRRRL